MATIGELNDDLGRKATELQTIFAQWYLCAADVKDAMQERIFVQSKGADGQELPSKPYSSEAVYVDADIALKSLSAFQVGKTGKKIKSAYFPNGYAQLKQFIGRPPLELSGYLNRDFLNTPQVNDLNTVTILVDDINADKIAGLERLYGEIFFPTEQELDDLVDCIELNAANTLLD
jgi:hypothetical protein